jgi:hypothetical protein
MGKSWKNRYLGALSAMILKGEVFVGGSGGAGGGEEEREKERARARLRVCLHF